MGPIYQKLEEFGSQPLAGLVLEGATVDTELIDKIRCRAFEIKASASAANSNGDAITNGNRDPSVSDSRVIDKVNAESDLLRNIPPASSPNSTESKGVLIERTDLVDLPLGTLDSQINSVDAGCSGDFTSIHNVQSGTRIEHPKFGMGTVISVQIFGESIDNLNIKFDCQRELKQIRPNGRNIIVIERPGLR